MKNYFEKLKTHIAENPPDFGDADSVLVLLYEAYSEINNLDDAQTKQMGISKSIKGFESCS